MSAEELFKWFCVEKGTIDTSAVGITDFPGHGRGAVALRDLPEGHTLFTIPRDLTLSTRTSSLLERFGKKQWEEYELNRGWVGLILCMMWEEAQGLQSKWFVYLSTLPSKFDTPMFWEQEHLKELEGTAVVDKIGKEEAEKDYHAKLIPAIKSRPDLFDLETTSEFYTVERYHIMGSRILSRSFHVELWTNEHGGEDDKENDEQANAAPEGEGMDVDIDATEAADAPATDDAVQDESAREEGIDLEDDDEEGENPADVAMVPMADMLNARFGSENAKLYYEKHVLKMITTKPIKSGEQIWNTYGDPPNSDLLRRYGHVDLVPLTSPLKGEGNPADIVEIRADLVVDIASKSVKADLQERIDWWLEEADDDVFVVGTDCELPEEMVSLLRLLLMSDDEWTKTKKSKLPKPKVDAQGLYIARVVLDRRIKLYPTAIEDDEALLRPENVDALSRNKKHGVIVRLGEKRILYGTAQKVEELLKQMGSASSAGSKQKKRARESDASERGKKVRR